MNSPSGAVPVNMALWKRIAKSDGTLEEWFHGGPRKIEPGTSLWPLTHLGTREAALTRSDTCHPLDSGGGDWWIHSVQLTADEAFDVGDDWDDAEPAAAVRAVGEALGCDHRDISRLVAVVPLDGEGCSEEGRRAVARNLIRYLLERAGYERVSMLCYRNSHEGDQGGEVSVVTLDRMPVADAINVKLPPRAGWFQNRP